MRIIVCSLILLTFFSPVRAATTPDKVAATEELFRLIRIEQQMESLLDIMVPKLEQMTVQLQLDDDGKQAMRAVLRDWWEEDIDLNAVKKEMIEAYANTFTLAEIEALNQFYGSAVGQKVLNKQPELVALGTKIGLKETQSKQDQLAKRFQAFLQTQKQALKQPQPSP